MEILPRNRPSIYSITCTITQQKYIGSTVNVPTRWNLHRTQLARNCHHSKRLQQSYNTHGRDAFVYAVIEFCAAELLQDREDYWMSYYHSCDEGFNVSRRSHRIKRVISRSPSWTGGKRGGARIGAGRKKRIGPPVGVSITAYLQTQDAEYLKKCGGYNSAGVHTLLNQMRLFWPDGPDTSFGNETAAVFCA